MFTICTGTLTFISLVRTGESVHVWYLFCFFYNCIYAYHSYVTETDHIVSCWPCYKGLHFSISNYWLCSNTLEIYNKHLYFYTIFVVPFGSLPSPNLGLYAHLQYQPFTYKKQNMSYSPCPLAGSSRVTGTQ